MHRYPRCGSTSLRLIGALSLTAAAVSGLELPAWPDRHGWSSHRCAHGSQVAEPSCSVLLTECLHERDRPAQRSVLLVRTNPPGQGIINFCQCARLCAHDRNSGNRTRGGSVYDERPDRYATFVPEQTVIQNLARFWITVYSGTNVAYRLGLSS